MKNQKLSLRSDSNRLKESIVKTDEKSQNSILVRSLP